MQQQIESTKAATAAVSLKVVPTATYEAGTGAGGFCPKCGAPLEADALFCIQCGVAIETLNHSTPIETDRGNFSC